MDYMEIELTKDKVAKVDVEDYGWLSQWKWYCCNGYAARRDPISKRRMLYMHRAILEHYGTDMTDLDTDHVNRKQLDNRKTNLRPATHGQNMFNRKLYSNNTSGFMGVYWKKSVRKWCAQITTNKQLQVIGNFDTAEEAAKAYDQAALKHHGEFATLNF